MNFIVTSCESGVETLPNSNSQYQAGLGQRIGLFGGSFNPAHEGHMHVAMTALRQLQLDWVWWIVARGNPLKSSHGSFNDRLASARMVAKSPRMKVLDIEARLGLTYTADTLAALKVRNRTSRFVWIMGSDNLDNFHHWRDWQTIGQTVPIAIVARPGGRPGNSPFERRFRNARCPSDCATILANSKTPAWLFLNAPLNRQSSTKLRGKNTKA